jgi:hypothetical protein
MACAVMNGSLSSAVRNSAVTLCSDNDRGDRGWAAVIGLTWAWVFRQIHSYERVLIYVGLKPTWKGNIRQVSCKPLLIFASRREDSFFVTPIGNPNDIGDFFGLVRLAAAARDLSSATSACAKKR